MSHNVIPIHVPGTNLILCGCNKCQEEREAWTNNQPPLMNELDPRDSPDTVAMEGSETDVHGGL